MKNSRRRESRFYAVARGKETGVFNTWAEAEKQVRGYHNADHKSFSSRQEAADYVKARKPLRQRDDNDDDLPPATFAFQRPRPQPTNPATVGAQVRPRHFPELVVVSVQGNVHSTADQPSVAGIGGFFGENDRRNFSLRLPPHDPQTCERAELYACLYAVRSAIGYLGEASKQPPPAVNGPAIVERPRCVTIRTASKYVCEEIVSLPRTMNNAWVRDAGRQLGNTDLWLSLESMIGEQIARMHEWYEAEHQRVMTRQWEGRANDNEACDDARTELARAALPLAQAVTFQHVPRHRDDAACEVAEQLARSGCSPTAPIVDDQLVPLCRAVH